MAALCAMLYADPLPLKRKEEMDASGVLYLAVVQNSRKWKMAREEIKKGMRQKIVSVTKKK
ncbi:hypothetical protein SS1G_13566 [Sclerotinia sclerotiorum 1980 UF-70]|uniref:Uncharacterized protein n=1 Tax=Sclerotinia sclerotiorum (strain ATCC 18683 / 1980 / Ss-1) TaxID=665079 RepID=A7F7I6_SCLS1|nr:hypothetical protein SS1G_13566 [Sclerotinia sclerotiorum 1980 UF-70]EDN98707.1 hypothetical protein SS1G_13566 [Sclerotinia sclerotiorum 1980 UF-70]